MGVSVITLWVGVSVITLAELVELMLDLCYYVGRIHGPYARGRQFSRTRAAGDRSPPPSAAASVSGCSSRRGAGRAVCQCGARFCEAAERRVSLSLTSRRRRCASCCDCACARSRGAASGASVSHVDNLYETVLPRSTA